LLNLAPMPALTSASDQPPPSRVWHGVGIGALVLMVLCLHLLAGHWISQQKRLLGQTAANPAPVEVILLQPQAISRTASKPASVAPLPVRRRAVETRRTTVQTKGEPPVLQALAEHPADDSAKLGVDSASDTAGATATSAGAAQAEAASDASTAATPTPTPAVGAQSAHKSGEQFSLPPAADLRYDTFVNGVQNMPGTINWITDGQNYDLIISVPIPFVGKYTYQSHGHVDAFGLAPERYTEQRGSRGRDQTDFDRSAKHIAFTRTPVTLALPDGAQDRFSMVFQLASLVRGNPARYTPGVTRALYVVDSDSGETWPVETVGIESLRVGETYITALHFMRLPRHADDKRKIDVWLAPTFGYFPARIVQTEPNGTQIELLLHDAPQRLEALSESVSNSTAAPSAVAPAVSGSVPEPSPAAVNGDRP